MNCDRRSEDCCKEAKFKVNVYKVKRIEKSKFFRYERKGVLSKLFLCEDHVAHFNQDKVNFEIIKIKDEVKESGRKWNALPPSLLLDGSTSNKKGWKAFTRSRYHIKQFKTHNPEKFNTLANKIKADLAELEKAVSNGS